MTGLLTSLVKLPRTKLFSSGRSKRTKTYEHFHTKRDKMHVHLHIGLHAHTVSIKNACAQGREGLVGISFKDQFEGRARRVQDLCSRKAITGPNTV